MLSRICECSQEGAAPHGPTSQDEPESALDPETRKLNDETEEGFAALAQRVLAEVHGRNEETSTSEEHDEDIDDDQPVFAPFSETKTEANGLQSTTDDHMDIETSW